MERDPGYTFSEAFVGMLNMAHMGALILSLITALAGAVLLGGRPVLATILFAGSFWLLLVQTISRLKHIKEIRSLRLKRGPNGGRLEVRHPESGEWLSADRILSFQKKDFDYADPWRPFTFGYPGIEIRLDCAPSPAEDRFPYSMEEKRDLVFDDLLGLYPKKAINSKI